MSYEINIILAKAEWCYHCKEFTPIYELATNRLSPANHLDNCKVNFLTFDMANEKRESEFKSTYPELVQYLKGYPSVYFQLIDTQQNIKKAEFIEHSVAKGQGQQAKIKAADEFINNIVNKYKSMISENKEVHITVKQKGGMLQDITSLEEVKYRQKYLKYKRKYLEHKNNY
jgi:hypothetical protein